MAVNHDPIVKRCRALDISPAVLGYDNKKSKRAPGGTMRRRKLSEYGVQLREKQKLKFIYGVLERQFSNYYEMAAKMDGITGENLITLLESRLDNVVFRMGMARTRREARQLVVHSHFRLNGKKANIPSMLVKVGDVISVKDTSKKSEMIKSLIDSLDPKYVPAWLNLDAENATATVTELPKKEHLDYPIEEHLIVELYSK